MNANPRVIELLNARLVDEFTGKAQYTTHLAVVTVWGYLGLTAYLQERIDDESRHIAALQEWIVFLGGVPTTLVNPTQIGLDIVQMHTFDQTLEVAAIASYNELLAFCTAVKDFATFEVVQSILHDEVDHERDLEAQLRQIRQMTVQNYLSAKLV